MCEELLELEGKGGKVKVRNEGGREGREGGGRDGGRERGREGEGGG